MDRRLTSLEARIDAVLPTLATRSDVAEVKAGVMEAKASLVMWAAGLAISLGAIVVSILLFAINRANPPTPQQAAQPTVVIVPASNAPTAPGASSSTKPQ